eukprot:m.70956 g.70956  ORF g.70956 m.70956 type:complete len:200 (+) comp14121_c0_seq1:184-783(+)
MSTLPRHIKCVVVGDGAVGKTSLLVTYATKKFPIDYVPTVFDNYSVTVIVEGEPVTLGLFDTAGQEEYDRLRPLSYPQTDIFLVCFSVLQPSSLENAHHRWVPEIKHHCPGVPFLLVATQCDLRTDKAAVQKIDTYGQFPVTHTALAKAGKTLGAYDYIECSAKTGMNLKHVFDTAIVASLKAEAFSAWTNGKRRCNLL